MFELQMGKELTASPGIPGTAALPGKDGDFKAVFKGFGCQRDARKPVHAEGVRKCLLPFTSSPMGPREVLEKP